MSNNIAYAIAAPRCGAQTRQGRPCREPACRGKRRCRMHGGTSLGAPRGNQYALKHGRYTAQAITTRRQARALLEALRALWVKMDGD